MDFTKLKEFMEHLTDWRIPGNSIVVYHKGSEVFRHSSGFSDIENKIKMTGDELINIYSCSKVATVVAALQLYERGKFLLDDPVYNYIEDFRDMYIEEDGRLRKAEKPITMRHLFTHTSGMSYNVLSDSIKEAQKATNRKMPTVELARAIAKEPLLFEPGERWNYSLSHDVLAAVVEVISGTRFADYVRKNIFEPIGADDVYYHINEDIAARMAEQYTHKIGKADDMDIVGLQISSNDKDGFLTNTGKDNTLVLGEEHDSGGAGIITSVPAYAKFANALASGGMAAGGERILANGTVELLRTNQLSPEQAANFNWSQLKGYGYGLGVRTMINRAAAGFNGISGEFGWGGAAGATILADADGEVAYFYAHHMLNPQEEYYQPRLRNVVYSCVMD